MSVDHADVLRAMAKEHDVPWPDGSPELSQKCKEAAEEIDRLRAEVATLRADVEPLTPREIVALFNTYKVRGIDDWDFVHNHSESKPVISSRLALWWYPMDEAIYIAQGLKRDSKVKEAANG